MIWWEVAPVKDNEFWSEIDVDMVNSEQAYEEQDGIDRKDCSGDHERSGKLLQNGTRHSKEEHKTVQGVVDVVIVGD